jgi:hypothetical protein
MAIKYISKKKHFAAFYTALIVFAAFIWGCNDQPTYIGSSLLLDTIAVKPITSHDTTLFSGSKSFVQRLQMFNSGVMFLGKYQDVQGLSMIRFTGIPDSLDTITEADIDSATLYLPLLRYALGDSLNQTALSFKIYEIVKLWINATTWDTLFASGTTSNYFDYSKVIGTFNGSIVQKDTMQTLSIPLDKSLLIDWFVKQHDTTLAKTIYGIVLLPDESSSVVRALSSLTLTDNRSSPYISVTYRLNTNHYTAILKSAIDASCTNANPPDVNTLTVQGGVSDRFSLSFDLSMIPDEAAIHAAEIEFTFDKSGSVAGNFDFDTTLDAKLYYDTTNLSIFFEYLGYRLSDSTNIYKFPSITSAIQYFIRKGKKGTLTFMPGTFETEYRQLDKMKFYNIDATDTTKRPVLRIIYSTRPKTKCQP